LARAAAANLGLLCHGEPGFNSLRDERHISTLTFFVSSDNFRSRARTLLCSCRDNAAIRRQALGRILRTGSARQLTLLIFLSSFFTNALNPGIIAARLGENKHKKHPPYSKETSSARASITKHAAHS
jgi:hypothetical protein